MRRHAIQRDASAWVSWSAPLALLSVSLVASLALQVTPLAAGPVAALFPPWWSARDRLLAAATSGEVLRIGPMPGLVVVASVAPDLPGRLHQAGALLLLSPFATAGCTTSTP